MPDPTHDLGGGSPACPRSAYPSFCGGTPRVTNRESKGPSPGPGDLRFAGRTQTPPVAPKQGGGVPLKRTSHRAMRARSAWSVTRRPRPRLRRSNSRLVAVPLHALEHLPVTWRMRDPGSTARWTWRDPLGDPGAGASAVRPGPSARPARLSLPVPANRTRRRRRCTWSPPQAGGVGSIRRRSSSLEWERAHPARYVARLGEAGPEGPEITVIRCPHLGAKLQARKTSKRQRLVGLSKAKRNMNARRKSLSPRAVHAFSSQ